jgi:predicted RND superfamily exporter protein
MNNIKDEIQSGLIIVLIIIVILFYFKNQKIQKDLHNEIQLANKEIVKLDTLKKERDGQYAKLVNYFENDKSLKKELKKHNKELSNLISKQNERILMLNKSIITLESSVNSGQISKDPSDSSIINLDISYPNSNDPFIKWKGKVFTETNSYAGEWTFGKLPIYMILTETKRGLWNSRIVGPNWLKVDSIYVNSLPPSDFGKSDNLSKIELILGGGYLTSLTPETPKGIMIGVGAQYKNSSLILNYGSISNFVGISYYHKIQFNKKH